VIDTVLSAIYTVTGRYSSAGSLDRALLKALVLECGGRVTMDVGHLATVDEAYSLDMQPAGRERVTLYVSK